MSRNPRVVIPNLPYHVTQRGNRKTDVFLDNEDYRLYLRLLRKFSSKYALRIWVYTLMTNHVHLIAVPRQKESLADALRDTHSQYATHFNAKYGFVGHLWQWRYFSCALDGSHLWTAVRYVERNPVRAGLVARAEDYPWSSARAHCFATEDPVLDSQSPLRNAIKDWATWLAGSESKEETAMLRRCTLNGRPCGSASFAKFVKGQA